MHSTSIQVTPADDLSNADGSGPSALPRRDISSRLVPPKRRGGKLCERKALLESLDETLQTQVTLITAPAGYGKTTLLAQWCDRLQERQIAVAYYAALERDREPTVFLAMIASALGNAGVDLGDRPAFHDGKMREDIELDEILVALELAGQPLILILDDFEKINDAAIAALMTTFIHAAPAAVHLVIATRSFPAIPLSTLELEGRLRLIDTYQLKFRPDELAWMLDIDPGTPQLQEIANRTQGWPVTAELYRLWRMRDRPDQIRTTFGGHVAEVQNYLAEQLFSSLPQPQFDLLVEIADRDEVSADLVDAMRERRDSAPLLNAIAHVMSSLMWSGKEGGHTVYRLHPLLLEHLRQTLEQDPARRARLAINASHWFLQRKNFPEAVRTALASRDAATIARVTGALRPIHIFVADGATVLRQILRELPDDIIASHPRLQIMAATAHFKAGFFAESRLMIDRIRHATDDFRNDPDGRREWLVAEGNLIDLIALCQTSRCSSRIEALYEVVIAAAADDPIIWGAGEIVMMLAWQVRGNFAAAEAAIMRARSIYNTVELSRYSHTQILGHDVLILMARGQLRRAVETIGSYQRQPGLEVPGEASTPTLLRLLLAAAHYEQEFSDTAVQALANSFAEHSRAESWFDQYAIAYPVIMMRLFMRDGLNAVLTFIGEARARVHRTAIEALPDFLTFLEIQYRVRGGDLPGAEALADAVALPACATATDLLAATRGWREQDAAAEAHIRLCFATGRLADGLAVANRLTTAAQRGGRLRTEIKGLILSALVQPASEMEHLATADLLKAVILAYPEGFVAPFAEEGPPLMPLIARLMADAGIDAYARRHLEAIRRAVGSAMGSVGGSQLTSRERQIVDYLSEGLSNKVIGRRMGVTDHTVKFHLKKIFSKLEVSSRRAAVAKVLATDTTG